MPRAVNSRRYKFVAVAEHDAARLGLDPHDELPVAERDAQPLRWPTVKPSMPAMLADDRAVGRHDLAGRVASSRMRAGRTRRTDPA